MNKRNYCIVKITNKQSEKIKAGHPWIFKDEIISYDQPYVNGDIVDVIDTKDHYLGTGFINDNSLITIRLFSTNYNDTYDDNFWQRRVAYAIDYRLQVMDSIDNARLIFGEADFFPGLTIDKYNEILVSQVVCLGMDRIKNKIYKFIMDYLNNKDITVKGIYERNDLTLRDKEGLQQNCGWYQVDGYLPYDCEETIIKENDILYHVDFKNGQKTGFFLDQKYNRKAFSQISKNLDILDCFTHTGSFGLNGLKGGAKSCTFVDISKDAMEITKQNVQMNGFTDKSEFVVADVFDYLQQLKDSNQHPFNCIVLDPPAFTKSRSTIHNAMKGYQRINQLAMMILPKGGYLITASCSHFASIELFEQMIQKAAAHSNTTLKEIEVRKQSKDHPILPNVDETTYLKFYMYQKV